MNEKEPCKPGGCSKLGCDGGHYCFNADGTPKVMSEEKKAELDAALREIFPQKGVGVVPQSQPPQSRFSKWFWRIMHFLVALGAGYYVVLPLIKYLIKLLQH